MRAAAARVASRPLSDARPRQGVRARRRFAERRGASRITPDASPRVAVRARSTASDAAGGRARSPRVWPPPAASASEGIDGKRLLGVAVGYCGACYLAMAFAYNVVPGLDLADKMVNDTIGAMPLNAVYAPMTVPGVLKFVNMFGTAMYAHAWTITAGTRGMDLMGCVLVGLLTAVGGGTIRQVLFGDVPVFWVREPEYLALAVVASACTFYLWPRVSRKIRQSREMYLMLNATDAIALGCFVVVGANAALARGHGALVGVLSALVTSNFGGVLRDVACAQPVRIMHAEQELYASTVCLGACAFLLIAKIFPNAAEAQVARVLVPILVVFVARAWAWTRDARLPVYADRDPFAGEPTRTVL